MFWFFPVSLSSFSVALSLSCFCFLLLLFSFFVYVYNPFVSLAFGAQFSCFSLVVAFVVGSLVCNAIFQHARPFCYCLFCFCFIRCYCCVVIAVIVVISFAICISRFFFFFVSQQLRRLWLCCHTHAYTKAHTDTTKSENNNKTIARKLLASFSLFFVIFSRLQCRFYCLDLWPFYGLNCNFFSHWMEIVIVSRGIITNNCLQNQSI